MRRSASEIIRNLEMRIARLERQSAKVPKYKLQRQKNLNKFIAFCNKYDLQEAGDIASNFKTEEFLDLLMMGGYIPKALDRVGKDKGQLMLTSFGEQILDEN